MTKKIIQFGFNRVGEASRAFAPVVDCRTLMNPFNRYDSDEVLRAKVRTLPGFNEKVKDGVFLLMRHDTIYVGCSYGKHRSWAVAEEIAAQTGAVVIHLTDESGL